MSTDAGVSPEPDRALRPLSGMLYGYVSAFVAAALLGFFFKYPVPFRGYVSGVEGLRVAPQAVVFDLFLGSFVIPLSASSPF